MFILYRVVATPWINDKNRVLFRSKTGVYKETKFVFSVLKCLIVNKIHYLSCFGSKTILRFLRIASTIPTNDLISWGFVFLETFLHRVAISLTSWAKPTISLVSVFLVAMLFGSTAFGDVIFRVTVGAKTNILVATIDCSVTLFSVSVIAFDFCWFCQVRYRTADIPVDLHFPVTVKFIKVSLDSIESLGLTTELCQCHERLIHSWKSNQYYCDSYSLLHLLQLASTHIDKPLVRRLLSPEVQDISFV